MKLSRNRASPVLVSLVCLSLGTTSWADDEDEFDFLEDEEDEILIAPSDGPVDRSSLIDMGDDDPDWDMEGPSGGLPESEDGEEDPVESFDIPEEEEFSVPSEEPEVDIRGREEDRGIQLEADGKTALSGNYALRIVAKDLDAVVVELPVLIASSRSDFSADFWVSAEIRVNGKRVGENRQLVTADSLSDLGASFIWIKSFVPDSEERGTVELRVQTEDPETGEGESKFSASVAYAL